MNNTQTNVPNLVQNPINGRYINLMPLFQFITEIADFKMLAVEMEDTIDWIATTSHDDEVKGQKENFAYRLVQLKHLFREISEIPTNIKVNQL